MKSFALVVNPVSGKGAARRAAEVAARHLSARSASVHVYETEGRGDAARWVQENQGDFDAVVAVGGDGTLREVIEGIEGDRTVGLVPSGTANVVSRDLGIPRRVRRAVRVLAEGRTRSLDMGTANGKPFLAMVGVGFDGAVVHAVSEARTGPISMASYLMPSWRTFMGFRPEPLQLSVDGVPQQHPVYGAIICNTRNYGALFSVTPRADLDDGLLDYQAQARPGRGAILRYALAALLRRETSSRLSTYGRGRSFRISAESPVAVQVDGDDFGTTPVIIEMMPARVRILAPDPASSHRNNHESESQTRQ